MHVMSTKWPTVKVSTDSVFFLFFQNSLIWEDSNLREKNQFMKTMRTLLSRGLCIHARIRTAGVYLMTKATVTDILNTSVGNPIDTSVRTAT